MRICHSPTGRFSNKGKEEDLEEEKHDELEGKSMQWPRLNL